MLCGLGNHPSPSLFVPVLRFQILGEASPVNIVLKLNQLISLLSSIEEKVEFSSYFISSSCHLLPLVCFLFILSAVLCHSKIAVF